MLKSWLFTDIQKTRRFPLVTRTIWMDSVDSKNQYNLSHFTKGSLYKLLVTVGAPGSGKSYWAREMVRRHPQCNIQIIERDLIRDQLDPNWKTKPINKKFEEKVSLEEERLLKDSLDNSSIDYVILANTHTRPEYRTRVVSLAQEKNTNTKFLVFHPRWEVCVSRNNQRKYPVPDSVLIDMWRRVEALEPNETHSFEFTNSEIELYFIGDIHSDYGKLSSVLTKLGGVDSGSQNWILPENLFVCFLGDLNDPRYSSYKGLDISFLKVFYTVNRLVKRGQACLVHSNHQQNLIRLIRGQRDSLSFGLLDTAIELKDAGLLDFSITDEISIDKTSVQATDQARYIANWLDTRPYFVKLRKESFPGEYVGVHAEFSRNLSSPWSLPSKLKGLPIYGSTDRLKNRIPWWKTFEGNSHQTVIFGHYHMFEEFKSAICIDTGCGEDGGYLTAYNPITKNYVFSE